MQTIPTISKSVSIIVLSLCLNPGMSVVLRSNASYEGTSQRVPCLGDCHGTGYVSEVTVHYIMHKANMTTTHMRHS